MTSSEKLLVRPVRRRDHEHIQQLAPELLAGMPEWRPRDGQRRAVTEWVDSSLAQADLDGHAVFVAVPSHKHASCDREPVLGFVSVTERTHFTGESEVYVGELVVHPSSRGQGVARALMDAAEEWGYQRGLTRLSLETGSANTAAVATYARLGYVPEQIGLSKSLTQRLNDCT